MLLPWTDFNRNRDKLFFFWSQDFLPLTIPSSVHHTDVPDGARACRAISRQSGVTVVDPISHVPVPRQHRSRQPHRSERAKAAQPFPLPNTIGAGGQYNWAGVSINKQPRRDRSCEATTTSPQNTTFLRSPDPGLPGIEGGYRLLAALGGSNNWPQLPISLSNS